MIALPVENIDLYYVDPSDSDFAKLGLNYTVKGETNLIGPCLIDAGRRDGH